MTATGSEHPALTSPAKAPGVVVRSIAGEVFLVPTFGELAKIQKIFVLDDVGQFVWDLLDGRRDLVAIIQRVTEEFEVEQDQATDDIEAFTNSLIEAGLVVSGSPTAD